MLGLNYIRRFAHRKLQLVFRFWDGRENRRADPIVLWRDLLAHEDYNDDDFKFLEIENLRLKYVGKISAVTRDVFSIRKVEEGGLTELECVQLLRAFRLYAGIQKKSGDQQLTSPTALDTTLSHTATDATNMNEDLACTSM